MRTRIRSSSAAAKRSRALLTATLAAVVLSIPACVSQTARTRPRQNQKEMLVKVSGMKSQVTTSDIRHARYGVMYGKGSTDQAVYNVAYVVQEGKAPIITGNSGFKNVRLTSTGMPERVKDYLTLSPILGIIGDRRSFTVGETYDSVMLRPEGRPHFQYTCTRIQEIAGVRGFRLAVKSVRYGTQEMDVVVSPDFPFPLYVKEYTGSNPITLILSDRGRQPVS